MKCNDHNLMSETKINALDMVEFLQELGFKPTRISFPHYWYLSPLRDERTASFKVNRKLNAWWDFGIQQGGKLAKFLSFYYRCPVEALPDRFSRLGGSLTVPPFQPRKDAILDNSIKNLSISPLTATPLLNYITGRRILQIVAQRFCKQATYTVNARNYFAIAFANKSGGYELRNRNFKGSSSPKDITLLSNHSETLCVFEGFSDFLSLQTAKDGQYAEPCDYLILNTLGFLSAYKPVILSYPFIQLYLDNDAAGGEATALAMAWNKNIADQRSLYAHYKDVNDWLCHVGSGEVRRRLFSS